MSNFIIWSEKDKRRFKSEGEINNRTQQINRQLRRVNSIQRKLGWNINIINQKTGELEEKIRIIIITIKHKRKIAKLKIKRNKIIK